MRPISTLLAIAGAGVLLAACASTQTAYIAPSSETIVSTTEERSENPPSHLIYIDNRSTVPVTVFSVSLANCRNVKQRCSPQPVNLQLGPSQRRLALKVEPASLQEGFGYSFRFSWRADSSSSKALSALAASGDRSAQERLAAID